MRLYADDVVVVAQFTCAGRESEVGDGGDTDWEVVGRGDGETLGPAVIGFVLEFESERFVLEVGQAGLRWDGGFAKSACLDDGY